MRSFVFIAVFFFAINVQARQQYKSDIPANRGVFGECNVCHNDITVNRSRNDFGQRAQSFSDGSSVSWTGSVYRGLQLFEHDTDGDGYSNGYELGDPNGTWDASQPHPSANITYNPSDPNDNPCGNGTIEGPEDCENDIVDGGNTCLSEGYEAGTLTCRGCFFDFTACGPRVGGTNNGTNANTNNSTGPQTNTNNITNNATTNNNSNSSSNTTISSSTTASPNSPNNRPSLQNITGTGGCSSIRPFSSWNAVFAFVFLFARKRRKK